MLSPAQNTSGNFMLGGKWWMANGYSFCSFRTLNAGRDSTCCGQKHMWKHFLGKQISILLLLYHFGFRMDITSIKCAQWTFRLDECYLAFSQNYIWAVYECVSIRRTCLAPRLRVFLIKLEYFSTIIFSITDSLGELWKGWKMRWIFVRQLHWIVTVEP